MHRALGFAAIESSTDPQPNRPWEYRESITAEPGRGTTTHRVPAIKPMCVTEKGDIDLTHRRPNSRAIVDECSASDSEACLDPSGGLGDEATSHSWPPQLRIRGQTSPARVRITDGSVSRGERERIHRELAEEAETHWARATQAGSDSGARKAPIVELAAFAKTGAESRIDRYCRASLGSGTPGSKGKSASDYKDNTAQRLHKCVGWGKAYRVSSAFVR